jgi:acyl carrier protein
MRENNSNNGSKANFQEDGSDGRLLDTVQAWMVVRLSEELNLRPAEIDIREPLLNYGLNSLLAFALTGELADLIGREIPATIFWDFPTLEAISIYVGNVIKDEGRVESLLTEMNHVLARIEEPRQNPMVKCQDK